MHIYFPFGVCLVGIYKAQKADIPPVYLMLIDVFCQILLVVGDPIWLGGFKMVYEVIDQLVLVSISIGRGVYGDFILDNIHEC